MGRLRSRHPVRSADLRVRARSSRWRALSRGRVERQRGYGRDPEHRDLRSRARWTFAAAVTVFAIVAAACSAGPSDTSENPSLYIDMSDFKIAADHPTIAAGHVVIGL